MGRKDLQDIRLWIIMESVRKADPLHWEDRVLKLSSGNTKLNKTSAKAGYRVVGFGLPAVDTCPGASACKGICFATQGTYRFRAVRAVRAENLAASQGDTFVNDMIAAIRRRRSRNVVRVHDSGDFYSQSYLDSWFAIARALPGKIFYAYTKSLHLDFTGKPDNFQVVQSLGGKYDHMVDRSRPHARIFATHAARIAAGYVDGNETDIPAIEGETRIGLVYHGGRNLTKAQAAYWV
jgi:hypothetical protein